MSHVLTSHLVSEFSCLQLSVYAQDAGSYGWEILKLKTVSTSLYVQPLALRKLQVSGQFLFQKIKYALLVILAVPDKEPFCFFTSLRKLCCQ